MTTRHRVPTVFTLYMVDVLCCALGCMILLWLLNLREANRRMVAAGEVSQTLVRTQAQLDETADEADRVRAQLASTDRQLRDTAGLLQTTRSERDRERERAAALLQDRDQVRKDLELAMARADLLVKDRDQARKDLQAARGMSAALEKELAAQKLALTDTAERLNKKSKEQTELTKEWTAAQKRVAVLEVLVREKETLAKAAMRSSDDLADRLRDLEARAKKLQQLADLVPGLRDDAKSARDKVSDAETRLAALTKDLAGAGKNMEGMEESRRTLTKDLAAARQTVEQLQRDKRALADQVGRVRAAAENRFAGIALTGKRVVFLIDTSGSMDLTDEKTPDLTKWVGVRETVARIMRSLPELEKFQVILFAEKVTYLLGKEDGWLDYDAGKSVDQVLQGLAAVKPRGNTNMYAAFEHAFRYRVAGMDTVYVFSDGLPNIGEGVTAETAKMLSETQKTDTLARHVRSTLKSNWNREQLGRPRVRINTVGFFYESPEVGAFLWALARENEGSFVGMSKP